MLPIAPRKYVIFETHFGRLHRETGRHIDFLVWIETPREIALARNLRDLLRGLFEDPGAQLTRDHVTRLYDYLGDYLDDVRRLTLMQQQRVGKAADLVVDGSAVSASVVEQVRQAILGRLG